MSFLIKRFVGFFFGNGGCTLASAFKGYIQYILIDCSQMPYKMSQVTNIEPGAPSGPADP
jgi:hypothetical protein